MSCNYAEGLSSYEDKGKCGLPEVFDDASVIGSKVKILSDWIRSSKYTVVHTGAGISTAAGIPDFRGPRGVWTLEQRKQKPTVNLTFDEAKPTKTHLALVSLQRAGFIHYIVSQNVDGLHLKSNFPRRCLSELHGNMFVEQCSMCLKQFVRSTAVPTVGRKSLNKPCPAVKKNGRACRGKLHDNILDWEDELPEMDLELATKQSRQADLNLALGSTLQIIPSGNLPLSGKANNGKFVVCNLQETKHDKHADLLIHTYVDDILSGVCQHLGVTVDDYNAQCDPTNIVKKLEQNKSKGFFEWTLTTDVHNSNVIVKQEVKSDV